jgi:hypothetical protein
MRVKIGQYRDWFGPYQLAEKILFWIPKQKDEDGFYYTADFVRNFGEWLATGNFKPREVDDEERKTWIYKLLLWIDSKKKRKVYVRIDPWDTWSMDQTLAHIVLPMLKQLKEKKHGSPHVDDEDVPEYLRSTSAPVKKEEFDTDDNYHLRWDWVMSEMIFAFEAKLNDEWEDQFTTGEYDFRYQETADGLYTMIHGPNHTAVTDWDARNAYAERMQNGFRLFGKYYQGLWD